ncbi:hypothetical protein BO443_210078 [Burkholderia orbicola]
MSLRHLLRRALTRAHIAGNGDIGYTGAGVASSVAATYRWAFDPRDFPQRRPSEPPREAWNSGDAASIAKMNPNFGVTSSLPLTSTRRAALTMTRVPAVD